MNLVTFIVPDRSELGLLKDRLLDHEGVSVLHWGEELDFASKQIVLDLTFDFFDQEVTPAYLYRRFADLQGSLESLRHSKSQICLIKNYPFSTDFSSLLKVEKILSQYIHLLIEYNSARLILIPNIIDRALFDHISHPAINIIHAAHKGKNYRSRVKDSSRVNLIYSEDLLRQLTTCLRSEESSNRIIEGLEVTLSKVSEAAQLIAGRSPIAFDSGHFVQYHYPNVSGTVQNDVHYELENMIMELMTSLF